MIGPPTSGYLIPGYEQERTYIFTLPSIMKVKAASYVVSITKVVSDGRLGTQDI